MLQTSTSEASGCSSSPGVSVPLSVKWARPAYRTHSSWNLETKSNQQPVLGCYVTLEFTSSLGSRSFLSKEGVQTGDSLPRLFQF